MEKIQIKYETEEITIPQSVEANCNEITFVNKSNPGTIIQVDGFPLSQNESRTDSGNIGELNKSKYIITANVKPFSFFIIRKIYK